MEVSCQCSSTAPNNNIIGTNNEIAFTAERDRRFYLNVAESAPCNGIINGWRYCFYNPDNIRNNRSYKTTFAVYRAVGTGYLRVPSVTTVSWGGSNINTSQNFNCYNMSVNSFTVQAGDIVAACVYEQSGGGSTKQLDIVGGNASGYILSWK